MPLKLYGVYLARFRFIESGAYKVRPVLIVSRPRGEHKIMLAIPLSSHQSKEEIDVVIEKWKSIGLIKPTVARTHRMTALIGVNVLEYIGQLDQKDVHKVKNSIRNTLEL